MFEESRKLEEVAHLSADWFVGHLDKDRWRKRKKMLSSYETKIQEVIASMINQVQAKEGVFQILPNTLF